MSGRSAIVATISALEHAAGGEPEEDVGAGHDVAERARVGLARVVLLVRVHLLCPALVHHAPDVGDRDVLLPEPEAHQNIEARQGGGTGAGASELDLGDVLADEPQAVQRRRPPR